MGQAISSAVSSSCALVVVATPGYLQSAVTAAELHILAECAAARGGGQYPVVVAGLQQPLHQVSRPHYGDERVVTILSIR